MTLDTTSAGFVAALAIIRIISIGIMILTVIAWWKIFKKAGQPGWKSLIPFYDGHVLYSLCWKPVYFWIATISMGPGYWMYQYLVQPAAQPNVLWTLLSLVLMLVGMVLSVKFNFKLAKSFGKGKGFGFGLWIFHTIFAYILAFGSAQYVGNMSHARREG